MQGRATGPGRSAYSMMAFISVEDPSSQTAGLFLQPTASQSKCDMLLKFSVLMFMYKCISLCVGGA